MSYVNGIGPNLGYYSVQPKAPNVPIGGKIISPQPPKNDPPLPLPGPVVAGNIAYPKNPSNVPYMPQPLAGLVAPPKLPKGPISQPPLAGIVAPPKVPKDNRPTVSAEEILEAIRNVLNERADRNNAA